MKGRKHEFFGKEVTDAIRSAVETLKVPQEQLDIEVLETGTTGIFGLIRKKAKIRVAVREEVDEVAVPAVEQPKRKERTEKPKTKEKTAEQKQEEPVARHEETETAPPAPAEKPARQQVEEQESVADDDEDDDQEGATDVEASEESIGIVRAELGRLIELMGYPSTIEIEPTGLNLLCNVKGDLQDELSGPEGKTLDSFQYLIRKIVARRCAERLRITVNVGNFREQRLEELKEKAKELAEQVKKDGRTQVLPALNPSERREIHMVLQDDSEVRSRSVGDGLFKKILIYKPGKTNSGGGGGGSRGRRGSNPRGGRRGRPRNTKKNTGNE